MVHFARVLSGTTCRSVSDDAASKGNSDKRHQKSIQNAKPRHDCQKVISEKRPGNNLRSDKPALINCERKEEEIDHQGRREACCDRGATSSLAAMGSLSFRTPMGDGP